MKPRQTKLDLKSLKSWLGYVLVIATYLQTNPDTLDKLGIESPWKDYVWEISRFLLWLSAAGYIVLRNNSAATPSPSDAEQPSGGKASRPATPEGGRKLDGSEPSPPNER